MRTKMYSGNNKSLGKLKNKIIILYRKFLGHNFNVSKNSAMK